MIKENNRLIKILDLAIQKIIKSNISVINQNKLHLHKIKSKEPEDFKIIQEKMSLDKTYPRANPPCTPQLTHYIPQ